jgi:hypothetical protein
MNDQEVEINLGTLLMAVLKRYETIEVNPEDLLQEIDGDYKLNVSLNEETGMFEISLGDLDAS